MLFTAKNYKNAKGPVNIVELEGTGEDIDAFYRDETHIRLPHRG